MNVYALIIGLGLAALVQIAFLPTLAINGVTPNLMLVLVVAWALLANMRSAAGWAVGGGLWLDLLSGGPFGIYTLSLLAAAAVAGSGSSTLYRGSMFLPPVMTGLSTLAAVAVQVIVLWLANSALPPAEALLRLLGIELATNLVLMLFLFPALAYLHRVTSQERLPLE